MLRFLTQNFVLVALLAWPNWSLAQAQGFEKDDFEDSTPGIFKASDLPFPAVSPNDQAFPNFKSDKKQRIGRALDYYSRFVNTYLENLPPQIRSSSKRALQNFLSTLSEGIETTESWQAPIPRSAFKIFLDNIVRNSQVIPSPTVSAGSVPKPEDYNNFKDYKAAYWEAMKDYYRQWCELWKADRGLSFCLPSYTIAMTNLFYRLPGIVNNQQIEDSFVFFRQISRPGERRFDNSGPLGIYRYLASTIDASVEPELSAQDLAAINDLSIRLDTLKEKWGAISRGLEVDEKNASASKLTLLKGTVRQIALRSILAVIFLLAAVIFYTSSRSKRNSRLKAYIPLVFLLGLTAKGWNSQSAESDGYPSPRISIDDRNYPNLAFSLEEAKRRKVDAVSDFLGKFEDMYLRSRNLPLGIVTFVDIEIRSRQFWQNISDRQALMSLDLTLLRDGAVARAKEFEASGGLVVFKKLGDLVSRKMDSLKGLKPKVVPGPVEKLEDKIETIESGISLLEGRAGAEDTANVPEIVKRVESSMNFMNVFTVLTGLLAIVFFILGLLKRRAS